MPERIGALAVAVLAAACAARAPSAGVPAVASPPPAQSAAAGPGPEAPLDASPKVAHAPLPSLAAPETHSPAVSAAARLQSDLTAIFDEPRLSHALWAVRVDSLQRRETLFARNSSALVMPASNMKIVTLAAAAERLGWDFRFETRLVAAGRISRGVLRGDLLIVGDGDPSIQRRGQTAPLFGVWAKQIRDAGVGRITGRIIGVDDAFEDEEIGEGWSWDDLAFAFAAPVGALQLDESTFEVRVLPAPAAGAPARIDIDPPGEGVRVINHTMTVEAGGPWTIAVRRQPGASVVEVTGLAPVGAGETRRTIAASNPTDYFVRTFRSALVSAGITVQGQAVDSDALDRRPALEGTQELVRHQSAPLLELAHRLMKASQNLYAETLLKTLGRAEAAPARTSAGRKIVEETLLGWGVSPTAWIMSDGSGLSRYNYVTADAIVAILTRMHDDPRHSEPFIASLPISGRDGTLRGRMRGLSAEGLVQAKTGAIANVRALSGYTTTADGERLVFSMIANNFRGPSSPVDAVVDRAMEALVAFSRRDH